MFEVEGKVSSPLARNRQALNAEVVVLVAVGLEEHHVLVSLVVHLDQTLLVVVDLLQNMALQGEGAGDVFHGAEEEVVVVLELLPLGQRQVDVGGSAQDQELLVLGAQGAAIDDFVGGEILGLGLLLGGLLLVGEGVCADGNVGVLRGRRRLDWGQGCSWGLAYQLFEILLLKTLHLLDR